MLAEKLAWQFGYSSSVITLRSPEFGVGRGGHWVQLLMTMTPLGAIRLWKIDLELKL
jgi:hypothetical protein